MMSNWLQFGYQYAAGGCFFFVTLLICLQKGASDLKNPSDRRAVIYLLAGFAGYMAFHLAWIILASP